MQSDRRLCHSGLLESIPSKLVTSEISILKLNSVAGQVFSCMFWSENPKTGFLATGQFFPWSSV